MRSVCLPNNYNYSRVHIKAIISLRHTCTAIDYDTQFVKSQPDFLTRGSPNIIE